jgi:cell volume regulation protein A
VILTAAIVAAGARWLGFPWTQGLLLGAIVSSTDAATIFSVLRGGGVHLEERPAFTVELESGLNDPMAAILTTAFAAPSFDERAPHVWLLVLRIVEQLATGAAIGVAAGFVSRFLVQRVRPRSVGVYPVLTVGLALLTYGVASLAYGSGFLAVYVAGILFGNGRVPNHGTLLRVHDFIAWASQIGMFIVLGLVVAPSGLAAVAPAGLTIALLLAFAARPVAVAACLLPFRFPPKEILLVGWVGLRGAVPIILAVIPILAKAPGGARIFNVVFFVVLVSVVLQGGTARWFTRWLGLGTSEPIVPDALLAIESTRPLDVDLVTFFVEPPSAVCGSRIADIPFPERASAMLLARGSELVAPKGDTELQAGDHVFVFCPREDVQLVRLLFGREAE